MQGSSVDIQTGKRYLLVYNKVLQKKRPIPKASDLGTLTLIRSRSIHSHTGFTQLVNFKQSHD